MLITKGFENRIKELISQDIDLFYTSSGNRKAFKLYVRHISYAVNLEYGKIKNNTFYPNKEIMIVDFSTETIEKKVDPFEFSNLVNL